VRAMQRAGAHVVIVSGGARQALLPLAAHVGVAAADVHAVDLRFGDDGGYADFDRTSPLTRHFGKAACVRALGLAPPVVAIGDGSTDLVIRAEGACDAFVAFTGFARREDVVAAADAACGSFGELLSLLLPGG
jgi:phosphoserine phosphatase